MNFLNHLFPNRRGRPQEDLSECPSCPSCNQCTQLNKKKSWRKDKKKQQHHGLQIQHPSLQNLNQMTHKQWAQPHSPSMTQSSIQNSPQTIYSPTTTFSVTQMHLTPQTPYQPFAYTPNKDMIQPCSVSPPQACHTPQQIVWVPQLVSQPCSCSACQSLMEMHPPTKPHNASSSPPVNDSVREDKDEFQPIMKNELHVDPDRFLDPPFPDLVPDHSTTHTFDSCPTSAKETRFCIDNQFEPPQLRKTKSGKTRILLQSPANLPRVAHLIDCIDDLSWEYSEDEATSTEMNHEELNRPNAFRFDKRFGWTDFHNDTSAFEEDSLPADTIFDTEPHSFVPPSFSEVPSHSTSRCEEENEDKSAAEWCSVTDTNFQVIKRSSQLAVKLVKASPSQEEVPSYMDDILENYEDTFVDRNSLTVSIEHITSILDELKSRTPRRREKRRELETLFEDCESSRAKRVIV